MNRHTPPFVGGILAALLLPYTPHAGADHPQLSASVGDYDLFLSVVPERRIGQYPDLVVHEHPIVSGANRYHLELAVVDRRTGLHVEDADVRLTVTTLDSDARDYTLNRGEMAGSPTYCSFAPLQSGDFYSFDATVEREDWMEPLKVGTWNAGG